MALHHGTENVFVGLPLVAGSVVPLKRRAPAFGNNRVDFQAETALFDAVGKGGDVEAAQKHLDQAGSTLAGYDGIPATKYALSVMGLRESAVRPPFMELSPEKKKELAERLKRFRG